MLNWSTQKVYLIQAGGRRGPVKIGIADNVEGRLFTMQTGNHLELEIRAVVELWDMAPSVAERVLHGVFVKNHIRGEWFEWDDRFLQIIREPDESTIRRLAQ